MEGCRPLAGTGIHNWRVFGHFRLVGLQILVCTLFIGISGFRCPEAAVVFGCIDADGSAPVRLFLLGRYSPVDRNWTGRSVRLITTPPKGLRILRVDCCFADCEFVCQTAFLADGSGVCKKVFVLGAISEGLLHDYVLS